MAGIASISAASRCGACSSLCAGRSLMACAIILARSAPVYSDVLALALAGVDLARPRDFLLGVDDHLQPLGDPPARAPDREHDREHRDRQVEGLVEQARVEVDVRVELARGEVVVVERALLELGGDLEQRALAG